MPARETANRRRRQTERLARLVQQASRLRGLRSLTDDELLEFARLYRRAASELSHAQAYGLDQTELQRLNWLVGRAYGLLYVSESTGWRGVGAFFRTELPRALRRHGRLIALSAALLLGSGVVGALVAVVRPDLLATISPRAADAIELIAQRHEGGKEWLPSDFRPIASSLIMVNNIQVSFLAFSMGILLCLGTVLVLIYNGLVLGAIAGGVSATAAGIHFWAFVTPHGVIELPAITVSAAAGLLLGLAVIEPGDYSRIDALRLAGRQAAILMLGVAAFLVIAGLVEGLFSPIVAPPALKFAVAAVLAGGLWAYVGLAGRPRPDAHNRN